MDKAMDENWQQKWETKKEILTFGCERWLTFSKFCKNYLIFFLINTKIIRKQNIPFHFHPLLYPQISLSHSPISFSVSFSPINSYPHPKNTQKFTDSLLSLSLHWADEQFVQPSASAQRPPLSSEEKESELKLQFVRNELVNKVKTKYLNWTKLNLNS